MYVIPAIDLIGGKVVRLFKGDYQKQTTYAENPIETAKEFDKADAEWIHVVDLDGAKSGFPAQLELCSAIASSIEASIEFGGGLRSLEAIDKAITSGVSRVILGTIAADNPNLVSKALAKHRPDRIVVGIDARDGMVATNGWEEQSNVSAKNLLEEMAEIGIKKFIYTDIEKDGTLTQPNFMEVSVIVNLAREFDATVIASGGVSKLSHLKILADAGVEATIIGSALYTGALNLEEAIKLAKLNE